MDRLSAELAREFPEAWNQTVHPVASYPDRRRPGRGPSIDVDALQTAVRSMATKFRAFVLFMVDMRPQDVAQFSSDLIYKMPWVEVVPVRSGPGFIRTMRDH